MDLYAQTLPERLGVPKVYSNIYQHIRGRFNISWFSKEALKAMREDWDSASALNKSKGIVHLPNRHLGRYGKFLDKAFIVTVHDLISYLERSNSRDRFYPEKDLL